MTRFRVDEHLPAVEIDRRYKACRNAREKAHWQVVRPLTRPDGPRTAAAVARGVGFTPTWVRTLVGRWNASGPDGLADRRQGNRPVARLECDDYLVGMSHADRLLTRPRHFRALTGLTPAAFRQLLAEVAPAWEAADARRKARRPRRRRPGAGPKFALPVGDMLLALLIDYRTYVPYSFVGVLFGIDDSTVCRNNRRVEPLLAGIFRIPEKKVRLSADEVREVFFDTTERPIPRPARGQRAYDSGTKKRHTVTHQVVVVRVRKPAGRGRARRRVRIEAVSPAHPGPTADKVIYDRTRVRVPAGATGYGDPAYQGTTLTVPHKRPRGGTLTPRRKAANRRRGRKRIAVEHGIGTMKVWRIAAERYRNPRRRHTLMFKNVAGLRNRMFG